MESIKISETSSSKGGGKKVEVDATTYGIGLDYLYGGYWYPGDPEYRLV